MMFIDSISKSILSILILFPLLIAFVLFLLPENKQTHAKLHRNVAIFGAVIEFILSLHLVRYFVGESYYFQFAQITRWFPKGMGINYIVGVDGLSLSLVILSTAISVIVLLTAVSSIKQRLKLFLVLFFILESTLIGVFTSLDVFLFYFFWEASLIPLYFMIGVWGGKDRFYATLKFFVYGVAASLFMLVVLIYLYVQTGVVLHHYSSNLLDIYRVAATLPQSTQNLFFVAFFIAFGIKFPIFPFYTWLPDTYEQSPSVYVMMSGVVLKLASYGLIRFALCMFPVSANYFATPVLVLGVIGIIYGALIAWQQTNIRRILAFSSLSHMAFILVGFFSFSGIGLQGSLYQMINHAVVSCAFFILVGFLEQKGKDSELSSFGGLAKAMPWFAFFFVIAAMGSVALPSTGSFLGEWLILLGVFTYSPVFGVLACLGVVFGAVYILWMTYKVLFGPLTSSGWTDIHFKEILQLSVLSLCIFILGFASSEIFSHSHQTIARIEKTVVRQIPYESHLVVLTNGVLVPVNFSLNASEGE